LLGSCWNERLCERKNALSIGDAAKVIGGKMLKKLALILLCGIWPAATISQTPAVKAQYKVTDRGWRNLRYIDLDLGIDGLRDSDEYWYVCDRRKIIVSPIKNEFDSKSYQMTNPTNLSDDIFQAFESQFIELDEFIKNRPIINKDNFIKSLIMSCNSKLTDKEPGLINAGSSDSDNSIFYYIAFRYFISKGDYRTFWLNTHRAEKVNYVIRPGSVLYQAYKAINDVAVDRISVSWLASRRPSSVMRIMVSCSTGNFRIFSETTYGSDGGGVTSTERGPTQLIIPGSVADGWRNLACLIQ